MQFGVVLPAELGRSADPVWLGELAAEVEALGFDEISVVEHSVVVTGTDSVYPYSRDGRSPLPDDCSLPDPLEVLAFLAARTSRLRLATGVLVLPNHHPVVLAKRLATLDCLSAGRLRICLGLGWLREEVETCGGDFSRRGALADEAIEVMRVLWSDSGPAGARFDGDTYRLRGAQSFPKPVRPAGVPLYLGGHSLAAARRAGRLAAGFQPLGLAGDALSRALEAMRAEAGRVGRDPREVDLVLGSTLRRVGAERVAEAEAMGASTLLLSPSRGAGEPGGLNRQLRDTADRLGLAA